MGDRFFVLHCKAGYEDRRRHIVAQFGAAGMPFEFVSEYDRPDLTPEICDRWFLGGMPQLFMSASLKHVRAMQLVVERNYDQVVVFEDDVVFGKDFPDSLAKVLRETALLSGPYVVYLSNACNQYTPRSRLKPGQVIYQNDHSRAADAYLINRKACELRLAWMKENRMTLPIDHQVNVIDNAVGVKIFWAEDPFVEQGSMNGLYASSIEKRHSLFMQRVRWNLDKFYKKHILRNLR